MATMLPPLVRHRVVVNIGLAVGMGLVGVAVWAIVDPDRTVGTWLAALVAGPIAVIALTNVSERRIVRRGATPGETGNVARLFSLVALLLVVPVFLLQVLPATVGDTADVAPHACPAGAVEPAGFADVPPASVHHDSIDCIAWWGVAVGVGDEHFAPAHAVSDRQGAVLFDRILERAGADPGQWDLGGEARLTRAELAGLLVTAYERAAGRQLGPARNAFVDDDGHAGEAAIDRAAAAGFLSGTSEDDFGPDQPVSRAQTATALVMLLDRLVAEEHVSPPT